MALFEGDEGRVKRRVHSKVLFTAAQPGRRVVEPAHRGDGERGRMDAEFQLLAVAALQDLHVQGHMTVPGAKPGPYGTDRFWRSQDAARPTPVGRLHVPS